MGAGTTGSGVTADSLDTRALALGDIDGEGDLDLLVGNDTQRNRLYLNNGTTSPFNDIAIGTFAAGFIEALQVIPATEGCDTNTPLPNYCPDEAMTRGGFAKMLAKTFGLMP